MPTYSVAEAKAKLSALIDEAMSGEAVTITRHGHPVVEVKAVAEQPGPKPRPMTEADFEWLARVRVGRKMPKEDAVALVARMRDEDWK